MDDKNLFDNFDDLDVELEDESVEDTEQLNTEETSVDSTLAAGFSFDDFDFEDDTEEEDESTTDDTVNTTVSAENTSDATELSFDDIDLSMDDDDEEQFDASSQSVNMSEGFSHLDITNNTPPQNLQTDIETALFDDNSQSQQSDFLSGGLLSELNSEGDWLTGASLEDAEANESILADTVDKNSFEGLFTTAQAPKLNASASVLEAGAMTDDAFSLKYLTPQDIIVWGPRVRKNTDITALTTSIRNDGLLQPLVVAPTQTEGRYVLIKGARRLLACATLGMKRIPCLVNSQITISDIHVVEPLYSHTKPYTVSDMLAYIDYLKAEKNITAPSMIEYLLNLNSGDYMKLMDVMDDNDDEIVSALLTGQLDIGGAFKKLEQKRKKMGKEKMSNARTEKIYGDAQTYGTDILADSGETGSGAELTEEEIKAIVEGVGDLEDVTDIDGEELKQQGDSIDGFQAHKQDPNNRERLDPKLRKAVLARDNNTCRICGMGGQEYSEVLDVHHIQEVYLGGNDDIDNLVTSCTCCHKLVHLWGRGELLVRPFDQMNEAEATKFKRIIKLGNAIRQGMAAKGMKKEQLKKLDQADTIGRRLKGSSDQVAG